jgi:hypothetical protein
MRVKKLTDSSVLKPGELLVVLHCLNQCGFDALGGSRKSIGVGVVQFYRHRQEPVPWVRRSKNGRLFRRPRTTNERRAHFSNEAKKSSNLMATPSNSGKDEICIGCPTLMTIYPFGISEAGRNIAEHSEGPQAASTAESTALPSGIGKIRRALPHHASGKYRRGYLELSTWRR